MKRSRIRAELVNARENVRIVREGMIDTWRTLRWSSRVDGAFDPTAARSLECQMIKDYHRVEKGLALEAPKQPFGQGVLDRLEQGLSNIPEGTLLRQHVSSATDALRSWNAAGRLSQELAPHLQDVAGLIESGPPSDAWFGTRRSVRHFSRSRLPNLESLESALETASASTPSVCNRQAWRAYISVDPVRVSHLLSLQNGNAGFRDDVPAVVVFTGARTLFSGAGERNQMYVDAALFAMSAAWVFHAQGMATCMLNWSVDNSRSAELRRSIGADDDEEIIMMMAVGFAADGVRVARSPRRAVSEVVVIVE